MYGYGNGWGMMGDGNGGIGGFSMVFWLFAVVLCVGAMVWFMRSSSPLGLGRQASARGLGALDLLEQRYARGEVEREEYLQKKGDLQA